MEEEDEEVDKGCDGGERKREGEGGRKGGEQEGRRTPGESVLSRSSSLLRTKTIIKDLLFLSAWNCYRRASAMQPYCCSLSLHSHPDHCCCCCCWCYYPNSRGSVPSRRDIPGNAKG